MSPIVKDTYDAILSDVINLLEDARRASARAVNSIMTATYWEIGRMIVELEQGGKERAEYGKHILKRLANDLTRKYGRGFSQDNLELFRTFYSTYSEKTLRQRIQDSEKPNTKNISETASRKLMLKDIAAILPLPWSHYVRLIRQTRSEEARSFYESEALRGGWTVRQLSRQIDSQFYERTALSRNKAAMLKKGQVAKPEDIVTPEEEVRDPFVLEFLGLKDEYSESDLEEALIRHLEHFLLELGNDFAFIGRQRRLRIDDEWYRVDLLFFHRRLRCLVIIDLKLGKFTHADAGQMHLYLNYALDNWTQPGENPPVGIILCAAKGESLVRYATDNLPNKLLVREYLTVLPDEKVIAAEIDKTRALIVAHSGVGHQTKRTAKTP